MLRKVIPVLLVVIFLLSSCLSGESKYEAIRVRGSDSEVNLVQALAESFMDIDSLTSVGVTGGGSGAGISALINHKTDLANSSRPITEEELYYAEKRDVHPYAITFALDALAIIVHKDSPIDSLTLPQLSMLYTGAADNWMAVGGADLRVTLYGRQSSSGTFIYFRDHVIQAEYSRSMIGMSGTAQIVEAIRSDRSGIGYVSSGYLNDNILTHVKVVHIKKDEDSVAFSPTDDEAIGSQRYPITRPLLQYTDGKPKGKLLDFILYQFSEAGQKIISDNGFYPVDATEVKAMLLSNQ